MSRYLVRADAVVTMNDTNQVIDDGAVIVRDDRIEAVGPAAELGQRGPFEREHGGRGFVLLPGLITGHLHTAVVLRRAFDSMTFERREPVTMYSGAWTEEDLYWLNLYLNIQLLKAGTTSALTIFYGLKDQPNLGCDPVIQSCLDSGLRVGFGIAARDRWDVVHARHEGEFLGRLPPELAARVRASDFGYRYDTAEVERLSYELAKKYHDPNRRFRIFACADWTPASSDELYRRTKRLARELDTGAVLHLLETPLEMLHSFRTYGKSAVARLRDIDFLGPEVTCTDCVWVTEEDIGMLADTGPTAVYTIWHITGFSGIAPVRQMLARGVRVAFGIMLRSQNDGYDTLADLGVAEHLQHVPGIAAEAMPAEAFMRMATVNGGWAMTRDGSLGTLAPGRRADLVLLDKAHLYDDPFLDPACDIHRLLVYRGRGQDVHTVIVDGKVVVEAGHCLTANEREAFERARAGAQRISGDRSRIQPALDLARELDPYVVDYYREWSLEQALVPWNMYNARAIKR